MKCGLIVFLISVKACITTYRANTRAAATKLH